MEETLAGTKPAYSQPQPFIVRSPAGYLMDLNRASTHDDNNNLVAADGSNLCRTSVDNDYAVPSAPPPPPTTRHSMQSPANTADRLLQMMDEFEARILARLDDSINNGGGGKQSVACVEPTSLSVASSTSTDRAEQLDDTPPSQYGGDIAQQYVGSTKSTSHLDFPSTPAYWPGNVSLATHHRGVIIQIYEAPRAAMNFPTIIDIPSDVAAEIHAAQPSSIARHSTYHSYLLDARSLANKKEGAAIIIQKWLTSVIFNRNLRRHFHRRARNKQQCRGAAALIRLLILPHVKICYKTHPAPDKASSNKPTTNKKKPYPTLADKHPFRQRGLELPSLPPKKKKIRPRRFQYRPPPRSNKNSSTISTLGHNQSSPIQPHPTKGCHNCPAFFHHQTDLDQHLLMCHLVKVPSPAVPTSTAAEYVLPQNPCPQSTPPSAPTSSPPTTLLNPSPIIDGGAASQDRVPQQKEPSPVLSAGVILPQKPYPPLAFDLLRQMQSALQQLPPAKLHFFYHDFQKWIGEPLPD